MNYITISKLIYLLVMIMEISICAWSIKKLSDGYKSGLLIFNIIWNSVFSLYTFYKFVTL